MSDEPTTRERSRWGARLEERRARHVQRSRAYRIAFMLAGATVTLAGIAMLVLPGPALVVIPIGLAMLAMEFAWAERWLERALNEAERAQRTAKDASPVQKALTAVLTIAVIGGLVAWGILGDIPVVPDP